MRIAELYGGAGPVFSLEVFPPKPGYPFETVFDTLSGLADLHPGFISVTYNAAAESSGRTEDIASRIRRDYGLESLAHLTCLSHGRAEIQRILGRLSARGVWKMFLRFGATPAASDPEQPLISAMLTSSSVRSDRGETSASGPLPIRRGTSSRPASSGTSTF